MAETTSFNGLYNAIVYDRWLRLYRLTYSEKPRVSFKFLFVNKYDPVYKLCLRCNPMEKNTQ